MKQTNFIYMTNMKKKYIKPKSRALEFMGRVMMENISLTTPQNIDYDDGADLTNDPNNPYGY